MSFLASRRLPDKLRGATAVDPVKVATASAPRSSINTPIGAGVMDSLDLFNKVNAKNITMAIIVVLVFLALGRGIGK